MADTTTSSAQASGWRISKACQECRKRKIKCNGDQPCKTCHLRHTDCVYRDVIRQRKKKLQLPHQELEPTNNNNGPSRPEYSSSSAGGARQEAPGLSQQTSCRREPPFDFNRSVSATHMTSSSCEVQLYYGSTSHFALMHEIYRDLTSHHNGQPTQGPHGAVEEAGAGLDMFSFRCIFFGIPADSSDSVKGPHMTDPQVMFLPYELANIFLQRFLSTNYFLLPLWSTETFQRRLEQLYNPKPVARADKWAHCILLMALALGSLGTEHHVWGDTLCERVRAFCDSSFEDTVNLQTHAHFQNEQGRPNSSFLHLGTAARKALSAGLHKESPHESGDTSESSGERRLTFWFLFFYESWICFHLGRPSSLSRKDIGIPPPEDSFLLALCHLAEAISRSADELYGQHHDSLLQMWRIAKSILDDLRSFDSKMKCALGFGLDKSPQPGGIGVRQTMFITLYYHTILLTFRPFLIFRGRWNQDMRPSSQTWAKNGTKREIPSWINEACNYALSAACRTIHFLCEAFTVNELVRELRYHSYFLSSSAIALIFDLIHGQDLAPTHLPWIHAAQQGIRSMRQADAIRASFIAIQTVLRKIDPSYEWTASGETGIVNYDVRGIQSTARDFPNELAGGQDGRVIEPIPKDQPIAVPPPMLFDFQGNYLQHGMHPGSNSASVGSGEDLLDFTQSEMGWNFDFSTMDLETFFSINPPLDPPLA